LKGDNFMKTNVYSARTLTQAYQILAENAALASSQNSRLPILAGGTDLMVQYNANPTALPDKLLDIWNLDELRFVEECSLPLTASSVATSQPPITGNRAENTPNAQLQQHPLVQQYAPTLIAAARTIGALQIQNRGTLGGNIVNGSPAGDSLPVLAAFDAVLELGSARGHRQVPFNQFYTGYRQTVLAADELLVAIILPKPRPYSVAEFYKVGTRAAQAISKVVMTIYATFDPNSCTENLASPANHAANSAKDSHCQRVKQIAVALGSVAPTVIRASQTEQLLANQLITSELIEQARQTLQRDITPISDVRSNATYRRTVSGNLLAKFFRECQMPAAVIGA
jgi:CO/xanthine dehydrogenase FAD-binding subunit